MMSCAMAALCLTLAGCNGASDLASQSLEQSIAAPLPTSSQMMALTTAPSSQAPAQPIATLPDEAGLVASVHSHDYVNGFRQDILLKGTSIPAIQNSLTVLARVSRQTTLDEATPLFKPTEPAIRAELGREFPHIAMQVVERPSSNIYGPYGLALGHGAGTIHCLYMWQWIDENRLPAEAGISGPMSLRVRLCKADTTFDAMASLVDRLMIGRPASARDVVAANDGAGLVLGPTDAEPTKPTSRRHVKHVAHRSKPITAAQSEAGLVAPQPVASASNVATPLSTDLPPQAYLGPRPGTSATKPN